MKNKLFFALILAFALIAGLAAAALPAQAAPLRQGESTPSGFERPLIVVKSYGHSDEAVSAGQRFDMMLQLVNQGQRHARNIVVVFTAGDLIPRDTGGVLTLAQLNAGEVKGVLQPLSVSPDVAGKSIASMAVSVTYMDTEGTAYTESLNLSFPVAPVRYSNQPTKTPTQVSFVRPQLVISEYASDVEPLQPGSIFNLQLKVTNMGNAPAKSVTAVLGGATIDAGSGTPGPGGGVSGSGGEFTNFAPIGSSNIQAIGDLAPGESKTLSMRLIVNVSINPGAFPVKFSFVYSDEKAVRMLDDQVITLLVYRLPQVEISFYRDPGMMFAGQSNMLPIQIVNLGRSAVVLGNMKVEAQGATLQNNISLVGAIESGQYFSLDATLIPDAEGPLDVNVSVTYTDDFNQSKTITQTIPVQVMPMDTGPVIDPGTEGGVPGDGGVIVDGNGGQPENLWQKVVRFFRGLFGLGSDVQQPGGGEQPMPMPMEDQPQVKPVPGGKGG